jgi:hypothetical protein
MRRCLALFAIPLAACADQAPPSTPVVRDSAGVEILIQPAGALDRPLPWTIDAEPIVRIGTEADDEHAEFYVIDAVVVLGRDQIAVLNAGTSEVRFFDMAARHIRSVGRAGSGPGEFRFPRLLTTFGRDSLLLYDMALRRFTVLTAGGQLRPYAGLSARHSGMPVAATPGGHVLTQRSTATARPDSPEEMVANTVRYGVLPRAGADSEIPSDESVFAEIQGQELLRWSVGGRFGFTPVPFDVAPAATAGPHGFLILIGSVPEVRNFSAAGSLVRVIRFDGAAQPLPRAAFTAHVDSVVAAARADDRAELRRRYRLMQPPETAPVFDRITIDHAGDLWLRRAGESNWVVADSTGRIRGRLAMPPGLNVSQIYDDLVLGHTRDELGVERVQVHRLTRQ